MSRIYHKFSLQYKGHEFHTMYAHMTDGTFTKTFVKDGQITSELIDIQEYASALATIMLPPSGHKLVPNNYKRPQ